MFSYMCKNYASNLAIFSTFAIFVQNGRVLVKYYTISMGKYNMLQYS